MNLQRKPIWCLCSWLPHNLAQCAKLACAATALSQYGSPAAVLDATSGC